MCALLASAPPCAGVTPKTSQALSNAVYVTSSATMRLSRGAAGDGGHNVREALINMGLPFGLASLVAEEDRLVALRIFVLDNSGSTAAYDGKYLDTEAAGGRMQVRPCTRWEEIRRVAVQQALMNAEMGVPCEFWLLNPPTQRRSFFGKASPTECADFLVIDPKRGPVGPQLAALEDMLHNTSPGGATPLGERLEDVHQRVRSSYSDMVASGLRCVIVLVTDGVPTCQVGDPKQMLVKQLRQVAIELPVFFVVRLATDDDNVVAYYNKVDEEEELPLEVIDDLAGEAREALDNGNGWLTYTPMIHAIREGGTFVRLFDLLDEKCFNKHEVRYFLQELLRQPGGEGLPADAAEAYEATRAALKSLPLVYDGLSGRMGPCIRLGKLHSALGLGFYARLSRGVRSLFGGCFGWLKSPQDRTSAKRR